MPNRTAKQEIDKRTLGKKRRLKLLGILLAIFLLWSGSIWLGQQEKLAEQREELALKQEEARQVKQRQIELTEEIKRLHDLEYIGEVARRDYFLSKPGEMIFKIAEEKKRN